MKQFMVIGCLAFTLASCNNADNNKKDAGAMEATAAPAAEVKLPFPLQEPYKNWQMGSTENVVAAMNSLRTFVDKDFTALAGTLADSIDIRLDYYQAKLSRDSALSMFKTERAKYSEIVITMSDYESVISADKKDEWVTIWYKQTWKDDKGVADSMAVIDDVKLKDGKMIVLDEKIQHFQVKK